ncbi:ribosome recycling factor [Dictyocaulus viviparus]|uniref:Ribosome-recycling factor, mitochondrial n=1 Tax=Dictyocaulus viviparus TaxID=29172 RepID=A0A0D8Y917_DICVI|nr:ribosome recycling factor [Dictyocaulus viviparus]
MCTPLFVGSSRLARYCLQARLPHYCFLASRIHSSVINSKVRRTEKIKKQSSSVLHSALVASEKNALVQGALKEMKEMEAVLCDELVKHFSLQVDLRIYEDLLVKLEKGGESKMSHLGRVSLKSPRMVMINFVDNPSAIKWAKLAIQKSHLNVTPQQEGAVLYIPVPRMTRERREQLAHDAKVKIFSDYKKALNDIYVRFDKSNQSSVKQDEMHQTRQVLLDVKHAMESRGMELIEKKRNELLTEVV